MNNLTQRKKRPLSNISMCGCNNYEKIKSLVDFNKSKMNLK